MRAEELDQLRRDARLSVVQREVDEWAEATFTHATQASRIAHLRREVGELSEHPYAPEEIADVFILLCGIVRGAGVDLADEVRAKLQLLRERTWGEPDAEGVVEHVR